MTFGIITQEDREKAKATKQAKMDWASENLFTDFEEDEKRWRDLASQYGIRLPAWYIENQPKYVKRAIKSLGVSQEEYLEDCGCKTIKQLVQMNHSFPAYSEVGLLLEWYHDKHTDKQPSEIAPE